MAYTELADISARAKEVIREVQELYFYNRNEASPLFNRIVRDGAEVPSIATKAYDNKYIIPYRDQFPQNFVAVGKANPLPRAGSENIEKMTTCLESFKGRMQQSWEESDDLSDDTGFIAKKSADIVSDALLSASVNMSIHLYGYEYGATPSSALYFPGIIGQVLSWDNATKAVTMKYHSTYSNELGVRWAMKGMNVLFGTTGEITGGTVPNGTEATISTTPDYANHNFVISDTDGTTYSGTAPAAGELVCLGYVDSTIAANTVYLSYDNANIPLVEHVGCSTTEATYQGLSRTNRSEICAEVQHNSGTAQALSEAQIRSDLELPFVKTKTLPKNTLIVMDSSVMLKYRALFDTLIYTPSLTDTSIKRSVVWSNVPQIDSITPLIDPFCWPGSILYIQPPTFFQIAPTQGRMIRFEDSGNGIFLLIGSLADRDVYEIRYRMRWQMACQNPGVNVRRKDIIS